MKTILVLLKNEPRPRTFAAAAPDLILYMNTPTPPLLLRCDRNPPRQLRARKSCAGFSSPTYRPIAPAPPEGRATNPPGLGLANIEYMLAVV